MIARLIGWSARNLVLVFVGFLGGSRFSGFDPLTGGIAGAIVTLWFTFVPCFLWIFAGAPYVETVRNVRWLANALSAVTAAVVGVIANLAVWFGLHVLFGELSEMQAGPLRVLVPEPATFDPVAALIAVVAAVALLRFHVNLIVVLAVAALAGDPARFLERNAKIQWGIMVCVYGLSHAPALLLLEFPRHAGRGAFLVFFLVIVAATAQKFVDRERTRLDVRIERMADGRRVVAHLQATIHFAAGPVWEVPLLIIFTFDDAGLITTMEEYLNEVYLEAVED